MKYPILQSQLEHRPLRNMERAFLMISPCAEDHIRFNEILCGSNCVLQGVATRREATIMMRKYRPAVVICERDLPDGDWRDVLTESSMLSQPPSLIVMSRLADEYLWAEVLKLHGHDLLAKPLKTREVCLAIDAVWRQWIVRAESGHSRFPHYERTRESSDGHRVFPDEFVG